MKGKIFIAWSGNNEIAKRVKDLLEKEAFSGIVGGASGAREDMFVGHTVLGEINRCNQAIFIVQKKDNGYISNNLMFEFGYSLSKFKSNKIHVFYIDVNQNDTSIPSDIQGIWAEYYKSEDYEDVARVIVDKFLSNQKFIIPENKMSVVNNYYGIKELILNYSIEPKCSEYELAQYILFFALSAYMNSNEQEALLCLRQLGVKYTNPSKELALAKSLAICYIESLLKIRKNGDALYLSKEDYRIIHRKLLNMIEQVSAEKEDDFSLWERVVLNDLMNYTFILYASNPDVSEEIKADYLRESLEYGESCLTFCDKLLKDPQNQYFIELFKAYMYRNLATAHIMLKNDASVIKELLSASYKMRELLWDYYNETRTISSKIFDTFEMEYYLALSEQLEYTTNARYKSEYMEECEDYIRRVEQANQEKTHFIRKIEINVKSAGEQEVK